MTDSADNKNLLTIDMLLSETLPEKKARAGRLGGLSRARLPAERLSEIGKLGGRPRLARWDADNPPPLIIEPEEIPYIDILLKNKIRRRKS